MYPTWMNNILVCPETKEKLQYRSGKYLRSDGFAYAIPINILSAVYPREINGSDGKYNLLYNFYAPLYDISERVMGKLIAGVNMIKGREEIISKLELKPGMRVLEVSPGPGVFQKFIRKEIGKTGELVALDLSRGMLRQCQKRNGKLNVHLVHANAQYLPFADDSFDALFHFGGVNLFNDPDKAISEFVRVVKKDGIVSWGDEGFSPNYSNERRKKFMTKINPGYAKPHPVIPTSVYYVKEHEVYNGMAYLVTAKKQ